MSRAIFPLLVAFFGYSFLNISQDGQKIGLNLLKTRKLPGSILWTTATLVTLGSALVTQYAFSLGNVSLVGAMDGSGLVSLALFSRLVMKEPIGLQELIGIGTMLIAAVLIGAFNDLAENPIPRAGLLFVFLGSVCIVYSIIWVVFNIRDSLLAQVISGFAGAFGGFETLFQKLFTTEHGRLQSLPRGIVSLNHGSGPIAETLINPYTLAWILLGIVSMVILQFSYRHGRAIQIIPWFSATYIVLPVLGGLLVFGENLHFFQWIGLLVMGRGDVTITVKSKEQTDLIK
jgi:uncharacterized membrane protein